MQAKHHHVVDRVALLNAVVGGVALYPQLYVLCTSGAAASGLSATSFVLILSNSIVWIWYGLHRGTYALVVSSVLNALASGAILLMM